MRSGKTASIMGRFPLNAGHHYHPEPQPHPQRRPQRYPETCLVGVLWEDSTTRNLGYVCVM